MIRKIICIGCLFCWAVAEGQSTMSYGDRPVAIATTVLRDSTRNDWTLLDRIYLIRRIINPASNCYPKGDSLIVIFEVPPSINDSASVRNYGSKCFDAISTAFTKENMIYKNVVLALCIDSFRCYYADYDMRDFKYKNYDFRTTVQMALNASIWPTLLLDYPEPNKKKTLALYHLIDTTNLYSKIEYIIAYYQSVSQIVADIIHKDRGARRQYDQLLSVFSVQGNFLHYWRMPVSDETMRELYWIRYFESSIPPDSQSMQNRNP